MKAPTQPGLLPRLLLLAASLAAAALAIGTVSVHGWLAVVLPATLLALVVAWVLAKRVSPVTTTVVVFALAFVIAVLARMLGTQGDGSLGRTVLATGVGVAVAQAWIGQRPGVAAAPIVLAVVALPLVAAAIVWFGAAATGAVLLLLVAMLHMAGDSHFRWRLVAAVPALCLIAAAVLLGVWWQPLSGHGAGAVMIGQMLPGSSGLPFATPAAQPARSTSAIRSVNSATVQASTAATPSPTAKVSWKPLKQNLQPANPNDKNQAGSGTVVLPSVAPTTSGDAAAPTPAQPTSYRPTSAPPSTDPAKSKSSHVSPSASRPVHPAVASTTDHETALKLVRRSSALWPWLLLILLLLVTAYSGYRAQQHSALKRRLNSGSAKHRILGAWIWLQRRGISRRDARLSSDALVRSRDSAGGLPGRVSRVLFAPDVQVNSEDVESAWASAVHR